MQQHLVESTQQQSALLALLQKNDQMMVLQSILKKSFSYGVMAALAKLQGYRLQATADITYRKF